jgi:hypothetical protein
VLVGISTNWGMRKNDEYIPKPKTNAVRLVVHTGRNRIIFMSTSGSVMRASTSTHTVSRTTEATMRPTTRADNQPQLGPSLTPTSSATSQAERRTAPSQSTLPGDRTGDSGT